MVTFNIINIVGAAASVSAIIDPDALARVVDLEKYALLATAMKSATFPASPTP